MVESTFGSSFCERKTDLLSTANILTNKFFARKSFIGVKYATLSSELFEKLYVSSKSSARGSFAKFRENVI